MDFLGKNYNYILFISAWSYIFLALACFIGQRTKLNKISYQVFFWIYEFLSKKIKSILGLSICYGIVKNLKGEISVKNIIGKGTTFYIKFPKLK